VSGSQMKVSFRSRRTSGHPRDGGCPASILKDASERSELAANSTFFQPIQQPHYAATYGVRTYNLRPTPHRGHCNSPNLL